MLGDLPPEFKKVKFECAEVCAIKTEGDQLQVPANVVQFAI
jgi:hypothetical protein